MNVSFSKIGKEIIRKEMDKVKSITSLNIDVLVAPPLQNLRRRRRG